jgi:hypothetical protein
MARTALTVQQISRAGLTPTYGAANVDGHSFPNGGDREFLHVKTGGTGCTVTVQTPNTVDGLAIADRTYVIGTSSERMIGPFPRANYNQGAEEVYVDFSSVTTVTIAAVRV